MYKVPGLTHMLNILDKISMGVTLDINKNASKWQRRYYLTLNFR